MESKNTRDEKDEKFEDEKDEFQTLLCPSGSDIHEFSRNEIVRNKLLSRLLSYVGNDQKFLDVLKQLHNIEKPSFECSYDLETL